MIPLFPEFKKLELKDKTEIEKFLRSYPPHSDFNFTSLWSYNIKNDIYISVLHNNLVVRFRDYISSEPFYSFLGENKVVETILTLLSYAKRNGSIPVLKLILEKTIQENPSIKNMFTIEEDNENHDYILSLELTSLLAGEKFHNIRNSVNHFSKNNKDAEFKILDLSQREVQDEIKRICLEWQQGKNAAHEDVLHEFIAIERLLKNAKHLSLFALGVFKSKKLIGFFIAEILHDGFAIGHFMKANKSFKGIFETMYKEIATSLLKQGCKHFNIEQDLGIAGIRKNKQQLNPVFLLKKYTIR